MLPTSRSLLGVVLLLAVAAFSSLAAQAAAPQNREASRLASLVAQPIPGRNVYSLANELRLRPPRHIDRVVRHTSPNYAVGHTDKFFVLKDDKNGYFVMNATIRTKTAHVYMYVQDGAQINESALQKAAKHFENSTYVIDHRYFGTEWTPGVDGDPHITCLIGDLRSSTVAGAFSAEDEYPQLVNPYSNAREMFYINLANTAPGTDEFDLVLAHEFQHMIHWHMHRHDNGWMNEGMSMLAEQLNHYSARDYAETFLSQPDTQLNSWDTDGENYNHYGAAYLFLSYLYNRFGGSFIRSVVADSKYTDFELINDALRKRHIHTTANKVFADWVVANVAKSSSGKHGVYSYPALPHTVSDVKSATVPFTVKGKLSPYATRYVQLSSPDKPFHLAFSAPSTVPVVGVTGNTPFWWSNRGDLSDTRLQRKVDLSHASGAHLHFRTWYNIENNYDYAYVEASTDGGKTWTTLRATDTTTSNPNAASYGNAYTGSSKGWRNETVDLSRYAGHTILIRFEYITDDVATGQGFVVTGITIPEIHFKDRLSGWTQKGFVPVTQNAMPSIWTVLLVGFTDKGITVQRMHLSSKAHGSMTVNPKGLKKLAIAVFTAAPKSTVKSAFRLSATP